MWNLANVTLHLPHTTQTCQQTKWGNVSSSAWSLVHGLWCMVVSMVFAVCVHVLTHHERMHLDKALSRSLQAGLVQVT